MNIKPPPTDPERAPVSRRRLISWAGGLGVAGFVGAIVTPLTYSDLVTAGRSPPADGLVGQRLVYDHYETDEDAIGGHDHHEDLFVRVADFEDEGAIDAVRTYPEHLVGVETYAILLHRLETASLEPPTDRTLSAGSFVAYSGVCTRCGSLLRWSPSRSASMQGLDVCPRDGCQFDPYRGGQSVAGPASRPLPQVGVARSADAEFEITTGVNPKTEGD